MCVFMCACVYVFQSIYHTCFYVIVGNGHDEPRSNPE